MADNSNFLRSTPEARAAARLLVQKRQPSPEILAYRRELERLGDAVVGAQRLLGIGSRTAG